MYELMVVGSTKTDSEKFLARVKKILEEASVANLKVERMGKKLLAYPIAKQTEGEYLVFNFEAEPSAVGEITNALRLEQEAVLRYLLTRVPRVSRVPPRFAKASRGERVSKAESTPKAEEKPRVAKAKVVTTTSKKVSKSVKSTKKKRKR